MRTRASASGRRSIWTDTTQIPARLYCERGVACEGVNSHESIQMGLGMPCPWPEGTATSSPSNSSWVAAWPGAATPSDFCGCALPHPSA